MKKSMRFGTVLLLILLLLSSCRRPAEDHHYHDHTHPWESKPIVDSGNTQEPSDTPVTGNVSRFSVWDGSESTAVTSVQEEPVLRVISTFAQWQSYCNKYYPDFVTKYGKDDFEKQSIVIYRTTEKSESIDLKVVDVLVKQEKLTVIIRRHEPFWQSSTMKAWCLFIEVEGNVLLDADSDVTVEFLSKT